MLRGMFRLAWLVTVFALGVDQAASAQDTIDAQGRIAVDTERQGGRAETGPAVSLGTPPLASPETTRRGEPALTGGGAAADSPTRQSDRGSMPATRVEDAKSNSWILEGMRGLEPDRA